MLPISINGPMQAVEDGTMRASSRSFKALRPVSRRGPDGDRGMSGPMHVEPVTEPNPLSAGFFRACEEMGHKVGGGTSVTSDCLFQGLAKGSHGQR
jgi:hypothetical protein